MPRLNTSGKAKERVRCFLANLVAYANNELTNCDFLIDKIKVRWIEEDGKTPKLIFQTKLRFLQELTALTGEKPLSKSHIREAIFLLKDFLKILEDNRTKTQGAEEWQFTLTLWHKSVEGNLQVFDDEWQRCKSQLPKPAISSPETDREKQPVKESTRTRHNLKAPSHSSFIGFKSQLTRLLKLISPEHSASLICIEGSGGVGKTTLALEAAHRCLLAAQNPEAFPAIPQFDAIIFTSAQSQRFVGSQLLPRLSWERHLRDIFRTILRTLDSDNKLPASLREQLALVQDNLSRQRTLLIIDNLETLEEQQNVFAFLVELPSTVQTIVTSRVRSGAGVSIFLDSLPPEDGLVLINHYSQEKGITLNATESRQIYQKTGGLPLAIACTIGYIAAYGIPPTSAAARVAQPAGDLLNYCFASSLKRFQGQSAHYLLMALSLFPQSAFQEALVFTALQARDDAMAEQGLAILHQLLLLVKSQPQWYSMHSLTREFASAELAKNPDFEQQARQRWVTWYLELSAPFAEKNWQEWQDYSSLEEEWVNLREVVDWCQEQEQYQNFLQFWQNLKGYTLLEGHWQERLSWLTWLGEKAEQQGDNATLADAIYHQSLTLAYQDQSDPTGEAITLAEKAWQLAQVLDKNLQMEIASYLAQIHTHKRQFKSALHWLNLAEDILLKSMPTKTALNSSQWLLILYSKAGIYFQSKDWKQAENLYLEAQKLAEILESDRILYYIQGWLAATFLETDKLNQAEKLLKEVLLAAEKNNDKRSLAFCQSYWARLEKKRGNISATQHWVNLARTGFHELQMNAEAAEIIELVN